MSTETEVLIEVTGVDLRELIRAAYDLSRPQGLGFLHHKSGELPEEVVEQIVAGTEDGKRGLHMDYVLGRSIKLGTRRIFGRPEFEGRTFLTADRWYDHGPDLLAELLRRIGRDGDEHRVTVTHTYEDETP